MANRTPATPVDSGRGTMTAGSSGGGVLGFSGGPPHGHPITSPRRKPRSGGVSGEAVPEVPYEQAVGRVPGEQARLRRAVVVVPEVSCRSDAQVARVASEKGGQ